MSNILFIHHVSSFTGGAEKYLYDLVSVLDRDHKVYFIAQEPGSLATHLNQLGVSPSFQKFPAYRRVKFFFSKWVALWQLIKFCRLHQIDLICSNSYRVTPYAVKVAKFLKVPSVTIVHDFVPGEKLNKFFVFDCNLLVTVSHSLHKEWEHRFKRKIMTVHNGMDIDKFVLKADQIKSLREEYDIPLTHKIVGMVGNFAPVKGHRLFLEAMKEVRASFPEVTFVVVGDSLGVKNFSMQDLKDEAMRQGIAQNVIFTGNRKDIASVLKSFDILVLPSSKESFGRVVMEAMAMEVAVVATDCGGPREIIEDGISGIMVPVDDAARIAQSTLELLTNDQKRKNLAQGGYLRVRQHFSPEKTYSKFNQIFNYVLGVK